MEHRARLIEYWQRCLDYQACFKTESLQLTSHIQCVELSSTKNQILATDLQQFNEWHAQNTKSKELVFFIPEYGQHPETNEIIFPYLIFANLDDQKKISPCKIFPYPIIGKRWLEGQLKQDWVLMTESNLIQYFQLHSLKKDKLTFEDNLKYINKLLKELVDYDWRAQFANAGYPIQQKSLMGHVTDLPQYQALPPDALLKANSKSLMGRILKDNPTGVETDWIEENQFKYAKPTHTHVSAEWPLSTPQRALTCQALTMEDGQWLSCGAGYQSGQTAVLQTLVAEFWLNAALAGTAPPKIMYLNDGNEAKPYSIFHIDEADSPLTLEECQSLYESGLKQKVSVSERIQALLVQVRKEFKIDPNNLQACKEALAIKLQDEVASLDEMNKLAYSYWEIHHYLEINYEKEGGVVHKLKDAEKNLAEHRAHVRHLQVLQSLWQRQRTAQPSLLNAIGLQPMLQKRQLKRLRQLFAEHLPEEDVQGLSVTQMEKRIEALLTRSQQCGRSMQDNVFQLQTDLRQLQITRKRYLQAVSQFLEIDNPEPLTMHTLVEKLDTHVRHRIFKLCKRYWQAELLLKSAWTHDDALRGHFLANEDDQPEWLFVESAASYSIQDLLPFLVHAKKALFMGQLDRATPTLISQSMDFYLLELVDEFINETEFEDLYYKGVLASSHGYYLAQEYADLKSADVKLDLSWQQPATIIGASYDLGNMTSEDNPLVNVEGGLSFVPVQGRSESYLGSVCNRAEAQAVVNWLQNNLVQLNKTQAEDALNGALTVVCSTSGQAKLIQSLCDKAGITFNNIQALCSLTSAATPWVVFSPVNTVDDPAPYLFNENKAALMKVLGHTLAQFVFIGDERLLDGQKNSPMGRLARYLVPQMQSQKTPMQVAPVLLV